MENVMTHSTNEILKMIEWLTKLSPEHLPFELVEDAVHTTLVELSHIDDIPESDAVPYLRCKIDQYFVQWRYGIMEIFTVQDNQVQLYRLKSRRI